jgi:uracil-DNA glycosylase
LAITDNHAATLALLVWYREMGIDAAVADVAIDWTARGASRPGAAFQWPQIQPSIAEPKDTSVARPAPGSTQRPIQRPEAAPAPMMTSGTAQGRTPPRAPLPQAAQPAPRQFPTAAPDDAVLAARAQARGASSLEALRASLMTFDGCALKSTAKSLCVYRGAATAKLMLIGDAPTGDDDLKGEPFSGIEGQLLDRMLAAIGLTPTQVHIANSVYWRPPGNRRPTAVELAVCRPFLDRQVELVAPSHIVLLGEMALQHMLDTPDKIMKARGGWRSLTVGKLTAKVLPLLHPSYLIKAPASKRLAWQDLLALQLSLNGPSLEGRA